jgi:predicted phage tail protein
MPSLIGSDDPGFKIVLGATLIAASFASGGALAPLGYLGAGLVVGGLVGVFMGGSGVFTPPDSRDPDKRDDFFFSGPINRTEQGYPVPVGYGRMFVGSTTISSGISSSYFTAPELLGGRDGPIRRPPGSNLSANGRTPP